MRVYKVLGIRSGPFVIYKASPVEKKRDFFTEKKIKGHEFTVP